MIQVRKRFAAMGEGILPNVVPSTIPPSQSNARGWTLFEKLARNRGKVSNAKISMILKVLGGVRESESRHNRQKTS